ncbi:MAG: hypothetical protein A3D28_04735 [Omnitrophica bacterium RIFCSPHIGHO2_02_FULL_63_14]|nr:MAG: hypothetical protein A3D28_04735 [Omnitrophica bacterium RIFCSPHIGHO2_02_FULL_63_14]
MIATITLNPSIDQHVLVEGFVKDDANRAKRVMDDPGGKGLNVSKVVRELGGRTHAYGFSAGHVGLYWETLVRRLDIPFTAVRVCGQTRINTIITDLKDRSQTRISAPGPRIPAQAVGRLRRILLAARPRPFLWALGGSLPEGMRPDAYARIIRALRRQGGRCILDTDDESLRLGILAGPFMIKPNEYEMRRLTGRRLESIGDYLRAARAVVRRGVGIVIVSLAARGALFVTAKDAFHVSTPRVPIKSRVGAGDSLIGGFALGLERRLGLREAARLGVAASTSAVMTEGTRLCRRSDIPKLLSRVKITPLI